MEEIHETWWDSIKGSFKRTLIFVRDEAEIEDEEPLHVEDSSSDGKPSSVSKFWSGFRFVAIVIVICLFFGLVLPYLLVLLVNSVVTPDEFTCNVAAKYRVPCVVKGPNPTMDQCYKASCCWDNSSSTVNGASVPYCFHSSPSHFDYMVQSISDSEAENHTVLLKLEPIDAKARAFDESPKTLVWSVQAVTDTYARIWTTVSGQEEPKPIWPTVDVTATDPEYHFVHSLEMDRFTFVISRKSDNTSMVKFNKGPLVITDNYTEFTIYPPSSNIYGLGESPSAKLKHSMAFESIQLMARVEKDMNGDNLYYGTHPFYMCIENSGLVHGVLLGLDQPTDIGLNPGPSISLRTSGKLVEVHLFTGPTPKAVMQQYTDIIGRPALPPYWALGYHTCRNYGNTSIADKIIDALLVAGIPHESDCGDGLLLRSISTAGTITAQQMSNLVSISGKLQATGRHMVIHQGPQVTNGTTSGTDVFIMSNQTNYYVGKASSKGKNQTDAVVYPDFWNPDTKAWFNAEFANFVANLTAAGVTFDGMFLVDNTPLDATDKSGTPCQSKGPPIPPVSQYIRDYYIEANDTICLNAIHYNDTLHYVYHNTYGPSHTTAVKEALEPVVPQPFLASLSTNPFTGTVGGHWGGEFDATWTSLNASIVQMLEFNLYGVPLTGAPICGYKGMLPTSSTGYDVCWRWMQVGAFYPLAFTYYSPDVLSPREPTFFRKDFQYMASDALKLRYSLLPYMYTTFYKAHVTGEPVVRPLFYEFPEDRNTWNISSQFLWGSELLVSPTLTPDFVLAYFPAGKWYEFQTHQPITSQNGSFHQLLASEHLPNLHIRSGAVLVTQLPGNTTTSESRKNNYNLIIALDSKCNASGDFFMNDGTSGPDSPYIYVGFKAVSDSDCGIAGHIALESGVMEDTGFSPVSSTVEAVSVLGLPKQPNSISIGTGTNIHTAPLASSYAYFYPKSSSMLINLSTYNVNINQNFSITLNFN